MSGIICDRDICKNILRETALIMLESDERYKNFGNKEAWDYNGTYLCGEDDQKSFCFFLRGETGPLARLGSFQIRVGQQGSKELLSLLCNRYPHKTLIKLLSFSFLILQPMLL